MNKSNLVAAMALTLILLTGCNPSSTSTSSVVEPTEEVTYETYTNPELGFEFQYPSDWAIRLLPEGEGKPMVVAKSDTGGSKNYFVIWPGALADNPETSVVLSEDIAMIDGLEARKVLNMWGDYEAPVTDGYTRLYIDRAEGSLDFTMEYPSNDDAFYQKFLDSIKFSDIPSV